jgi:multiple sugar transport system ATP-binding protein
MNRRVAEAAKILGIEDLLERRPRELSGGQRQRVAMGRAIVRHPQAFLMDEPLSNLDAKLRVQMRGEISRIQRDLGVTTLYVTHDQTEAMTLGHKVAVMRSGVLQQMGSPQELYRAPANAFVGAFIGSPAMNMLEAILAGADGDLMVQAGSHRLRVPQEVLDARPALRAYAGRRLAFGIRPEDTEDAALVVGTEENSTLHVTVNHQEDMGSELILYFELDAPPVVTEDTRDLAADRGTEAVRSLKQQEQEQRTTVTARVSARSKARPGERAAIHVDMRNAHFFDLETGDAIYGDRVAAGARVSAAEKA